MQPVVAIMVAQLCKQVEDSTDITTVASGGEVRIDHLRALRRALLSPSNGAREDALETLGENEATSHHPG